MNRLTIEKKRRKRRRRKPRRKPINVLASGMTTLGLYCGVASSFASVEGKYEQAAYLILAAIVFDMLDGSVAKITNSTSEFGKQLDSLADLVSFGVAPAILIFTNYILGDVGETTMMSRAGALIAGVYVICGALRLARFTLYQSESRDYFVGLPIPAAGGTIASLVLFTHYLEMAVAFWLLGPITLSLAFLMVSKLNYPKDKVKAVILAPRNAFPILLSCGVIVVVFGAVSDHSPAALLFPAAAIYVLFGVGDFIYRRFTRKSRAAASRAHYQPGGLDDSDAGGAAESRSAAKIEDVL